jgi:molecular chaperone HtpG
MNNNTGKFTPVIGKNVIENLTVGMYDDARFVYREYVQNAADQIDIAKRQNLYQSDNEACIYIQIDKNTKTVIIEDNATGIESQKVLPLLGNIAQSIKNKYEDKGFRGIGRLGGLGYCDKLTFETSFYGEGTKSIMTWDAKLLKKNINDDNVKIDAAELISIITDYSFLDENEKEHYFKVIMEGVENEELLDIEKVRDYLSMVAPIPFASHFTHRHKIYEHAKDIYKRVKDKNITFDEYNLILNNDQLFKGYKNSIFKNNIASEEDKIVDVDFFEEYFDDNLLFWGWYGISQEMHQIPDENKERGIRLRKSNIQIGLDNRLDVYHKEDLGNRYFIGEVYAIHKELIPNARRDFFVDNEVSSQFSKHLRDIFHKRLYTLYYDFSKKNSAIKTLQDLENLNEKIEDKSIDNDSKEKLSTEKTKLEKRVNSAKTTLSRLANKYKGQVLEETIKEAGFDFESKEGDSQQDNKEKTESKHTENTWNNLPKKTVSKEAEILLQKVYSIIRKNLIKETAEELIRKIEEEVRE